MSKVPAILSISFRPFFILVALIAIFNPMLWVLSYLGHFRLQLTNISPLFWHGHEMIFGFSGALIAGFILTASANWTSSEPYKGSALLALISVWLLERLSYFLPINKEALFIISNLFFPLLSIMLLLKLFNFPKQKYVFVPILLTLTLAKLLHSGGYLFENGSFEVLGKSIATGVLRLIILLIAGRVIPFFTSKKLGIIITVPSFLNLINLSSIALLVFPWGPILGKPFVALILVIAIISNVLRQLKWCPEKAIKIPILFILHVGIAFINISLVLEFLGLFYSEINFSQAPLHMLMAAGAGTIGVGIMTRVSLGHTGRIITADRLVCLAYVFIIFGALLRVMVPIFAPTMYLNILIISACFWSGGFVIFLLKFWNILVTPRPDGK